ncbi:hypothetical protein DAPPUDRAFT_329162 [Daphnia pulex]|uniref:Uncharacterized protein n=1 Tax=Daphnia pulex TaxID=6669 RepID=E9HFV1_DAPPU|nr:hypothetical protein DAPPUDRAFT_329162 [Daphnia pulex]|eukprot:EFX69404.1 hypothetical protein DAPPUDRAFT_329162 [Daphnia pulex]
MVIYGSREQGNMIKAIDGSEYPNFVVLGTKSSAWNSFLFTTISSGGGGVGRMRTALRSLNAQNNLCKISTNGE